MATCDLNALMADGKCFSCIGPKEKSVLKLQMLCEIQSKIATLAAAAAAAVPTVQNKDYAANFVVDFDGGDYQLLTLAGDINLASSLNRPVAGRAKSVALVITCDGSDRTLTYNANWTPIGTDPSGVTASKVAVVSITALGPDEDDILIVIQEQP